MGRRSNKSSAIQAEALGPIEQSNFLDLNYVVFVSSRPVHNLIAANLSLALQCFLENNMRMFFQDVFYSGSVTAIPDFVENRDKYRSLTSSSKSRDEKSKSLEPVDEEGPQNEANRMREIWRYL